MRFFDGAAVDRALGYPSLIDVLQQAFEQGAIAPLRHHHAIRLEGRPEATLLLMPAWEARAPGAATAGRYLFLLSPRFDTNSLRNGIYELHVRATDIRGNTGTLTRPFSVANTGAGCESSLASAEAPPLPVELTRPRG